MQTMDIFVVTRWERYEGERNLGFYRKKEHAEYVRDHAEALEIDSYVMSAPTGRRDEMSKNVHWLDEIVGFTVSEEEVYL